MPSSSYTLFDIPNPQQTLVHVYPDATELGRVYQPALAIEASPTAFAASLERLEAPREIAWRQTAAEARADYLDRTETPKKQPGAFQYGEAMVWLRDRLPEDAIIANGAGNFAVWVHRFMRMTGTRTQLSPTSGSMGYGPPAAIMAKRCFPDRVVVCFAGDGDFLMNGQEFATAVQYGIAVIVVVVDNSMYGTIRMHQERDYPGRISATKLVNPDFAAYARAFGGYGERVERTEDFAPAFERAVASGQPAIIHCLVDQEAITPDRTLSEIKGTGAR
jgi:acetolactate synthase-1/2/3 large subunit